MAFPGDWNRRATVTIDPVEVDGTLTDFPLLCTVDNLPSEMFDADGSNPAQNGGGDIRFSSDEDGDTQLATEVVSFVTDNNPANGTAQIWVKVASVSTTVDTIIYVWYKTDATDTQPAVTGTYGRNAVWSNSYAGVWHMEEDPSGSAPQMVDSTGNGNNGTSAGTMTTGDSVAGKIGNALDFDGSGDFVDLGGFDPFSGNPSGSISFWVYFDPAASGNEGLVAEITSSSSVLYYKTGDSRIKYQFQESDLSFAFVSSVGTYEKGVWLIVTLTWDATNTETRLYVNGVLDQASTAWDGTFDAATGSGIARNVAGVGTLRGLMDGVRSYSRVVATAEIAANYSNQNAPGTFATAGTPVGVGAAAITITDVTAGVTDSQSILDDLTDRRGRRTVGHDTIWFLELQGATIIEPTAFEPDAATYRGTHYYNVNTNTLFKKIVTRNEPGIVVAHWQKVSE